MADISDAALEEALNLISNAESTKTKHTDSGPAQENDQLEAIMENLKSSFSENFLNDLNEIDVESTNNLIESVLGELISKELLYEPFVCMKVKIENEIKVGNKTNEKGLHLINSIIEVFDNSNNDSNSSDREKLMQLIYELQKQGDLWKNLSS